MEEREVVLGLALPADQQGAEAIVPTTRAFDHPAARPTMDTAEEGRLTLPTDMRHNPALPHAGFTIEEVVALVQAEVLGTTGAARRTEDHRVQGRGEQPLVVDVRGAQRRRERDAAPVGEEVAFGAALPAVRRVRSREVPPFGAFTRKPSSAVHCQAIPRRLS